jgi:hypothetical protein
MIESANKIKYLRVNNNDLEIEDLDMEYLIKYLKVDSDNISDDFIHVDNMVIFFDYKSINFCIDMNKDMESNINEISFVDENNNLLDLKDTCLMIKLVGDMSEFKHSMNSKVMEYWEAASGKLYSNLQYLYNKYYNGRRVIFIDMNRSIND